MTKNLRLTLRVDTDSEHALGVGKVRLMELIDESGSISKAGKAMGMSYRRAWLLVDDLNQRFATPLVETQRGGGGGGGAALSETGRDVVKLYRRMEKACLKANGEAMEEMAGLMKGRRRKASPVSR
ncbi:molybdate transport system regulatory protein [Parvibaculum indicum]|uniref:winged helix-turn-helix domain-containing protein n=1 Tax=Parvibaculum indicum TaxID=562969 RepID=UPI001422EDAC|nr:LysR family transcriptional regulator [Parvibaculum indicum]NIJ42610.1 molybdate transport system regulatory protein [Parvibaculum indicum]